MNAEKLKEIRTKLGLTQKEFGIKIGFKVNGAGRSIGALENGEREVSDIVANAARYLEAQIASK